ncbi:DUF6510 family protein [Streptacidiphilus melanogenes]|uniref:DUF6510 family protein n=1 Tax=Streptacidiphilus melanogenes TaxID=411235 RepID=UPI0005A789A2|nr:DUF6510 family protein [Streptacidiphilus melanogenes]
MPVQDGNALAGPLSEVFAVEVTSAWRLCPGCGTDSTVGALRVYTMGTAAVARCPHCGEIAFRLARHAETLWLDFGGGGALRIPVTG